MIIMTIQRSCKHFEKIAIAGFSGDIQDIPDQYKAEVEKNIQWQRDELCFLCFDKLTDEVKQKLFKEVTDDSRRTKCK